MGKKIVSYSESGSGSINGVAPNGSMFASNILLIIELPAIEAARPALKPDLKEKQTNKFVFDKQRNILS